MPPCHLELSFPFLVPVIEEANWMTLDKDVPQPPGGAFDAVICLGNSFAHLPDCKGETECTLEPGPLSYTSFHRPLGACYPGQSRLFSAPP